MADISWAIIDTPLSIIITSRGSPPSASFRCIGALPANSHNGTSMMALHNNNSGTMQCFASDTVNRIPILDLMECIASDYAVSLTAESGDRQTGIRQK